MGVMGVRSAVMVGREAELGALLDAVGRADSGEAQVALVRGEAGIGKTRLVRELASSVPGGAVVCFGHAVAMSGVELSYGVAGDLLRSLVREVGLAAVVDAVGPRTSFLAPLVPQLVEVDDLPLDRLAVHAVTQDLLVALSAEHPLVLIVEDMHWADESSLDLLVFWARTLIRARVLIVVTARDTEGEVDAARLRRIGEIRRLPNAVDVSVPRLSDEQVVDQLRELDVDVQDELMVDIQRLSSGNPLYVEELVASAVGDPTAFLRLDLTGRLGVLAPAALELVELAALEARPFQVASLAAVAQEPSQVVAAALDDAVCHGLLEVVHGGRFRFHHELLRRAAADSLSVSAREHGHRQWAEHWSESGRGLADLIAAASHWYLAGARREAFDAYVAAAEQSTQIAPSSEADQLWRTSLAILHEDPSMVTEEEHVFVLGGAAVIGVDWSEYKRLVESEAAASPRPGGPVDHYVTAARLAMETSVSRDPTVPADQLRRLLDGVAVQTSSVLTFLTLTDLIRVLARWGFPKEAQRALDLAESMVPSLPVWATAGLDALTFARIMVLRGRENAAGRLEIVTHALEASRTRDRATQAFAHDQVGVFSMFNGDLEGGLEQANACMTLVPRDAAELIWRGGALLASWSLRLMGRLQEAVELARQGCQPSGDGLGDLLLAVLARGDEVSTEQPFGEVPVDLDMTDPGSAHPRRGQALALSEAVGLAASAPDRAVERLTAVLGATREPTVHGDILATAATVALRAGVGPGPLVELLRAVGERDLWAGPLDDAWKLHLDAYLDRLADHDTCEEWSEVAACWDRLKVPYHGAEARLRGAELLLDAAERAQAESMLREALEKAERIGAHGLVQEIRGLAQRGRIPLSNADAAAIDVRGGLTGREFEVLQLLVTGLTNDQIAGELYLSPKTVSVHVSHILAKLAATNRTQVAAIARRQGLVRTRVGRTSPRQQRAPAGLTPPP